MLRRLTQLGCMLLALIAGTGAEAQRIKPPPAVTCPRDHLTVYSGRVVRYRRSANRIRLRIRTDWDTTESVTLQPPAKTSLEDYLLLSGNKFTQDDWKKIESRPRRLRPTTRVNAWVCDDGRPPVFDWHPGEEPKSSQKPR